MERQIFLPEARCQLTTLDSSIPPESYIGKVVNVLPKSFDCLKQEMQVFIGDSFSGIIPLDELSIYDLKKEYGGEESYYKILSQFFVNFHLITAKILDFDSNRNSFILSRKENMENALRYFLELDSSSEILYAFKTGSTSSNVFVDIGAGIQAIIPYKEISACFVDALNYFEGTDYIPVHILFQNVYGKFVVSYRSTIAYQDFKLGDVVPGRVVGPVKNNDGISIELNPNQSGILNADYGLHVVQCDNANWFIIPNENKQIAARSLKQNETYLFAIKRVKDSNRFKLSLL